MVDVKLAGADDLPVHPVTGCGDMRLAIESALTVADLIAIGIIDAVVDDGPLKLSLHAQRAYAGVDCGGAESGA